MSCYVPSLTFAHDWFGKSLPEQTRTHSLASHQENHALPSWYNWLRPVLSRRGS